VNLKGQEEALVASFRVLSWHMPEGLGIVRFQVEIFAFYFWRM
jgi:hypothetical protein